MARAPAPRVVKKEERPKREVTKKKEAEVKKASPKKIVAKKDKPKKVVAKKGHAKQSHPPYASMIKNALKASERGPTSLQRIAKFIEANYKVSENYRRYLRQALKKMEEDHTLIKVRASYKLSAKAKKSGRSRSKSPSRKKSVDGERSKSNDEVKVKGVRSAYWFFCNKNREDFKKKNPDAKAVELVRIMAGAWKNLSAAKKKEYEDLTAKDKLRYLKEKQAAPKLKKTEEKEGESPKKKKRTASKSPSKKGKSEPKKRSKKETGPEVANKKEAAPKKRTTAKVAKGPTDNSVNISESKYSHFWQYEDNGWKNYEVAASDTVEEVYQGYIANRGDTDVRAVHSGSWEYQVDFMAMKQTNIQHENHTVRNIRRVLNSAKPTSS